MHEAMSGMSLKAIVEWYEGKLLLIVEDPYLPLISVTTLRLDAAQIGKLEVLLGGAAVQS